MMLPAAAIWHAKQLAEGVELLGRAAGFEPRPDVECPAPTRSTDDAHLERWLVTTAGHLGLDVEPVCASYRSAGAALAASPPAILRLPSTKESCGFLVLLEGGAHRVTLLLPDGTRTRVATETVRAAWCAELESAADEHMPGLMDEMELAPRKRIEAWSGVLNELLGDEELSGCWRVLLPPGRSFLLQLRRARVIRQLATVGGLHLLGYAVWVFGWFVIGAGALSGRIEVAWLAAWVLLLLMAVPVRWVESLVQGKLELVAAALLKRRLLAGALHLEPDEVRHLGAGRFLPRVIESEAVESYAMSAGFCGIAAAIELPIGLWILAQGAGGPAHAAALAVWVAVTLGLAWRLHRRNLAWTEARLEATHDLVERMVGHRTRIEQEPPDRWHRGEDELLDRYLDRSRALDGSTAALEVLVPGGWLVFGLGCLAPAFLFGTPTAGLLAISVGGVLAAQLALDKLAAGLASVSAFVIAWRKVGPLFRAAAREDPLGAPGFDPAGAPPEAPGDVLLSARDLAFRFEDRRAPVFSGCNLDVHRGERILMQGESGGGKSTFGSLLLGLREPSAGLVLLRGLDRSTWGAEQWRRQVAAAPQFHENHVFAGTLAFNLLLARRWPPTAEDLAEAVDVCRELGLAELLERMPAGLQEQVGETGWRLSHGERSRIFVARALLQNGALLVLDESFAALDPGSLRSALQCTLRRAPSLLVIAHP